MKAKRYNLVLSEKDWGIVQQMAKERQTTVADILRMCIRLGLEVHHADGAKIIIRKGDKEAEIILI